MDKRRGSSSYWKHIFHQPQILIKERSGEKKLTSSCPAIGLIQCPVWNNALFSLLSQRGFELDSAKTVRIVLAKRILFPSRILFDTIEGDDRCSKEDY